MAWPSNDHPIWALIRLSILMLTLSGVLWLTATDFDVTEVRTIITIFLIYTGAEGGLHAVRRLG